MTRDNSNRLPVNTKLLTRFFEKIRIDPNVTFNGSPCWLWTRPLDRDNYGRFWYETQSRAAHNVSYRLFVDEIPAGLVPDHLCRVRHCVNPAHLEIVTNRINTLRGETVTARNAQKTHCLRGHEFTIANTRRNRNGGRICRQCTYEALKRHRGPIIPRTHCRNGHLYTRPKGKRGVRRCAECNRQSSLKSYHKLKGIA